MFIGVCGVTKLSQSCVTNCHKNNSVCDNALFLNVIKPMLHFSFCSQKSATDICDNKRYWYSIVCRFCHKWNAVTKLFHEISGRQKKRRKQEVILKLFLWFYVYIKSCLKPWICLSRQFMFYNPYHLSAFTRITYVFYMIPFSNRYRYDTIKYWKSIWYLKNKSLGTEWYFA